MLEPSETIFPNNVVKFAAGALAGIDPDIAIFKRLLRNTDPQQSIGVHALLWTPDQDSLEMQGLGAPAPQMPTIQRYTFAAQAFVKDTEQDRGLAVHTYMSQRVRSVLYTDPALQVIFAQLSADLDGGWVEKVRRWGVTNARYLSGEINAQMLYLSTLEFWIETETKRST